MKQLYFSLGRTLQYLAKAEVRHTMAGEKRCTYLFHESGLRKAHHRVAAHSHTDAWHYDIIRKGHAVLSYSEGVIAVAERAGVMIPPRCRHAFKYGKRAVSYLSVKFSFDGEPPLSQPILLAPREIQSPVATALTIYLQDKRILPEIEREIVSLLLRAVVGVAANLAAGKGQTTASPFEEARSLIRSRIHTYLKVEEVASRLGYTSRHLNTLFHRSARCTVKEYIDRERAEYSREYLLHTMLSVKEIAANLGFRDASDFSRFFGRHYGMSPRALRKQQKH